jgi:uncharacterized protein
MSKYTGFEALDPYFALVQEGLRESVNGDHYFDLFAEDAVFESRYQFPGWPVIIRGRADLIAALSVYDRSIRVHAADGLLVHPSRDGRTVVIEYDVHGTILRTAGAYENRLISVVTIENRKIVHWRDYMDSLAAWTALNPA